MANFCPNCGNQIDEGTVFCGNCGFRLDAGHDTLVEQTPPQLHNQPTQQYNTGPQQQYVQPEQQYIPYSQPEGQTNQQYPQYNAQPPKKKTGLIIGLTVGGAVVIATIVIIAIILVPLFKPHGVKTEPDDTTSVNESKAEILTDTLSDTDTELFSDTLTEAATDTSAEISSEASTELSTEDTEEPSVKLPYEDSLGKVEDHNFAWIADAQSGNLTGSFLSNDDLIGKWKGEIIYDGAWELVYVTIDRDGKITIEPYQINYGEGWKDETGEKPYIFDGVFELSSVNGSGSFGSINLYTFLEDHGTQYGVGTFSVNNSSSADVYLVRP